MGGVRWLGEEKVSARIFHQTEGGKGFRRWIGVSHHHFRTRYWASKGDRERGPIGLEGKGKGCGGARFRNSLFASEAGVMI